MLETPLSRGVWCIGYNAPTAEAAPNSYLTAPLFHWDAYYKADLEAIMAGTREPSQRFWGGLTTARKPRSTTKAL